MMAIVTGTRKAWLLAMCWGVGEKMELGDMRPGIMDQAFFSRRLLLLLSRFSHVRLCDPIDTSPPGSPIPGILQARTLEWVAISFSNA